MADYELVDDDEGEFISHPKREPYDPSPTPYPEEVKKIYSSEDDEYHARLREEEDPDFVDVFGAVLRKYSMVGSGAAYAKRKAMGDNLEELELHDERILHNTSWQKETIAGLIAGGIDLAVLSVTGGGAAIGKAGQLASKSLAYAAAGAKKLSTVANAAVQAATFSFIDSSARTLTQETKPANDILFETAAGAFAGAAIEPIKYVCKKAGIYTYDLANSIAEKIQNNWEDSRFKVISGEVYEYIKGKLVKAPEYVQRFFKESPFHRMNDSKFETVRRFRIAHWSGFGVSEEPGFSAAHDVVKAMKHLSIPIKKELLNLEEMFIKETGLTEADFSKIADLRTRFYNTDITALKGLDPIVSTYWDHPSIKRSADVIYKFSETVNRRFKINSEKALRVPNKKLLTAEGLEAADKMADVFLPRSYNKGAVLKNTEKIKGELKKYFELNGMSSDEIVDKTYHNMLGNTYSKTTGTKSGNISPLKSRHLNIQDLLLHEYMEHDVFQMIDHITSRWIPHLAQEEALQKAGFNNLEAVYKGVRKEAMEMFNQVESRKLNGLISEEVAAKEKAKITMDETKAYELLNASNEIYHGYFGAPKTTIGKNIRRGIRWLKTWTYLKSCGSILFSMATDPLIMAQRFGWGKIGKAYWLEMKQLPYKFGNVLRRMVNAKEIALPETPAKMCEKIYGKFGTALEEAVEDRTGRLLTKWDENPIAALEGESKLSRWVYKGTRLINKTFLADTFQAFNQKVGAILHMSDFAEAILGKGDPKIAEGLIKESRIDKKIIAYLREQLQKPGVLEERNGLTIVHVDKLDEEAFMALQQETTRVVNNVTLTPDAIHMPFWTQTFTGKCFSMFLGWTGVFTSKFIVPTFQKKGLIRGIGKYYIQALPFAAVAQYLKELSEGNPSDLRDYKFWSKVADKMGIPTAMFQILWSAGGELIDGGNSYNVGSAVKGVSAPFRTIVDIYKLGYDTIDNLVHDKKFTRPQKKTARQLFAPILNTFYINNLIDAYDRQEYPYEYRYTNRKLNYLKRRAKSQ